MANGGRIDFTVGYKLDKTGLNEIKKSFDELKKLSPEDLLKMNNYSGKRGDQLTQAKEDLIQLRQTMTEVQTAFQKAFDPTTGITNIKTLNTELNKIGIDKISQRFSIAKQKGNEAFYQIAKGALTTNMQLKQSNKLLDQMAYTLGNTIRWGISSAIMNKFVGSVQQAYGYVQHLDSSLNDIRIVTGKSADEMDRFAEKANKTAKGLGQSTTAYTEAALIYYQQGLSDEEAQARAETTLKAANVTGQSGREVSEQLTAVWNGYKVTAEETEVYVDKLAAVAASTASDLEELSTGMSKVASAANNMGVDIDQLNAQLATIISVTRQAPETAGTALKTIYARMEDLKISGEDEDGVKLGEVSSTLEAVGVSVMDTSGDLRDLGEVIEEVASKWDSWTSAQQNAIAQALAGKRQYNNLLALFDNWDMYTEALETSRNSLGTLQQQQDIYMESTAAHLQTLKTQTEDFYDSLLNKDDINTAIDGITGLVKGLTNFLDGIGQGRNALLMFGSTAVSVFSKQIAQGVTLAINNLKIFRENAQQMQAQISNIQLFEQSQQYQNYGPVKVLIDSLKEASKYYEYLSNDQIEEINRLARERAEAELLEEQWNENVQALEKYYNAARQQEPNGQLAKINTGFDLSEPQFNTDISMEIEKDIAEFKDLDITIKNIKEDLDDISDIKIEMKDASKDSKRFKALTASFKESESNMIDSANLLETQLRSFFDKGIFDSLPVEQVDNLRKALNRLGDAEGDPQKIKAALAELEPILEKIGPAAMEAFGQLAIVPEIGDKMDIAAAKTKQFYDSIRSSQIQQFSQQLTQGIASIGQFASALNSLKSGFSALGDESLSTSDKIIQFLSGTSMGVTMLMSSMRGLNDGLQVISNGSYILTQFMAQYINYIPLKETVNALDAKEVQEILAEANALGILNGYRVEDIALLNAENKAKLQQLFIDEGLITQEDILKLKLDKGNISLLFRNKLINDLKTKIKDLPQNFNNFMKNATIAGPTIAAAAIAAVMVAFTIADKAIQKIAKRTKERAEKRVKEAKEIAEKTNEEYENVQKLVEAYKNLKDELGDTNIEAFRRKIYELSQEYGVHIDQLKLMTASYEELEQMMIDLQTVAQQNKFEADLQVVKAEADAIKADMIAMEADALDPMAQTLKTMIMPTFYFGYNFVQMCKEELDNIHGQADDLLIDIEDFLSNISGIVDSIVTKAEKFTSWLQKALDVLTNFSLPLQNIENTFNLFSKEEDKKTLGERVQETINTPLEVAKTVTAHPGEVVQELKDQVQNSRYKIGKENMASSSYRHYQNIEFGGEAVQDMVYVDTAGDLRLDKEKYLDASKEQRDEILKWYDQYYVQQKDFLGGIIKDTEAFEKEIFETGDSIQEYQNDLNAIQQDAASNAYDSYANKTNGEIKDAYSYQEAKEAIVKDLENQSDILMLTPEEIEDLATQILDDKASYDVKAASYIAEKFGKDEAGTKKIENQYVQSSVGEQHFISENIDWLDKKGYLKDDLDSLKEEFADFIEYENNQENVLNVGVALNNSDGSEFKPEDIEKMFENEDFEIELGISKDDFVKQTYEEQTAALVEYYTKLNKKQNELAKKANDKAKDLGLEYQKGMDKIDWSAYKKGVQTLQKSTNSAIDDLQGAYSSLTSIMEEYNSTQTLSMDNLQALLNMDTAYLSALKIENGQMTLNEDALKNIALAKLDEAEAEAYAQAMEELHNDETRHSIEMAGQATITMQQMGNAAISAGQAAASGAAGWKQYWDQALNREGVANDAYAQQVGAALQTKLQAINAVRDQVKAGNFGTTMKGPSSGSGSGGGSSSEKEADHEDYLEREADIYKTINEELDQIESTLGRIQTVADHKWGIDAQKALEKENKLLDKQLEKLKEKKAMQERDLSGRRGILESVGVQFSEDGSAMLNSEAVLDAMYAKYNSMVDTYNNMSAAEQETYKAQLEAEEKRIKDIEDKIDAYESSFSDYQDTLDKLLDAHYAQIENEVKLFNNMVDVHLELNDARKEWDKFWSEVVEDVQDNDFAGQIAASMKQLKTLVGLGGDVKESDVYTLTQHLIDTTTQVNAQIASANRGGEDSIFGDDTALSKENLQNYIQQLMDAMTAAKENLDNIAENYLKILDDAQDKIDKQIEGWESINDHLEHNLELIKLISGDKAFDALDKQFEKQYENSLNLLTTQKAGKDFWAGEVDRYEKLMASVDKNSKQYQTYEEAYNKSVENYRKAVSDLDKTVETSIKNLQDWRKNAVDNVMDTLDKAMSKGMGLDNMEKQWKLINDYASKYLDNVERALGMEEYTNVLDEAVNATGLTAANQEKLNQFREVELAQLNQKNKLTQFDLDESKARLEILKQQMALEDARNNKSNMRLRRDSQGNYTYQYTGDQEAEDQAENGLLTARREWYELVKARNKETRDDILAMEQQYQDNLKAMDEARLNNDIATLNALEEANKILLEEIQFGYEQAEIAKRDLFQGTAQFFTDVEDAEILPMWEATIDEMVDEWSGGGEDSFIGACTKAIQDLESVQDKYVDRTHQVLNTAGIDYNKLKEKGIDPTDESLQELVMDNEDFATILEEVNDLLSEQEGNLRDVEAAYYSLESAAVSALTSAQAALVTLSQTAIQTVQDIQAAISAANAAYSYGSSTLSGLGGSSGGGGGSTGGLGNTSNTPKINVYKEGQTYGNYYYAYYNGKKYTTTANDTTDAMSQILDQIRKEYPSFSGTSDYTPAGNGNLYGGISLQERIRRSRAQNNKWGSGYATGGYTGDWDQGIPGTDNGRLAILHQKELVLNADDTSNMLKAVEVVRQLFSSNIISGIAQSLLNIGNEGLLSGISSGVQSMSSHISNSVASNNSNITINADFSGVHDADEIYEAFTQLQNTALQSNFSTAPHLNISY